MVSRRGQDRTPSSPTPSVTATQAGRAVVEEFAYGLGPPDGILALRYPPADVITDFPESRNDFVHQVYWSPDGVVAVNRGGTAAFAGPGHAVWVRQGVVAEVTALDVQTVTRFCVRRAPEGLTRHDATVLAMTPRAVAAATALVRPGTDEAGGLAARVVLLDELAGSPADPVGYGCADLGPARAVARALSLDPGDRTSLAGWAERLHISPKTLQREFERAFGTSFSTWRTRTRLQASLAMLSRWSVTETAHRVGYATASSYVAAFTREYGEPPARHAGRADGARAS